MTASLHFLAANAMFQVIRPRTGYAGKVSQAIFAALRKGAKRRAVKENGLAWQELQNMLDAVWDFGPGSASPDRCRSLWAIEGLGFFEAERTYSNDGALPRLAVDGLPPVSASVFLLGVHLAAAIRVMRGTRAGHSPFLDIDGRDGLAIEALGFVTRTLFPAALGTLSSSLDRQLQKENSEAMEHFWHGVGRGLYFLFPRALFSAGSRSVAVEKAAQEAPHETGRRNTLRGLAFAMTLVNILHPEVLEDWLKQHPELRQNDAFSYGRTSATTLWRAWVESIPWERTADLFCYHSLPVIMELEPK